jgi:hypothetical protein
MEDQRLQEFKSYFKTKWLEANTTLGIGLLRDQKITDARRYFWQTLSEQKFNLRTLCALIISFIPANLTHKIRKPSKFIKSQEVMSENLYCYPQNQKR